MAGQMPVGPAVQFEGGSIFGTVELVKLTADRRWPIPTSTTKIFKIDIGTNNRQPLNEESTFLLTVVNVSDVDSCSSLLAPNERATWGSFCLQTKEVRTDHGDCVICVNQCTVATGTANDQA